MHVTTKNISDTNIKLTMVADPELLEAEKRKALKEFAESVKIQGFREGKAPLHMVEKAIDPARLQTEFLEHAINRLYVAAVDHENLRPVSQPKIAITKFVPYSTLEVEAEVEVVGAIKLADYKKLKVVKDKVAVEAKEVDTVIDNLRTQGAEKKDVDRAAKQGDEAWIDFVGVDAKTKEAITGADGKDYPLILGSNTFIPGFEPEIVGLKAGDEKTFTVTFPKDYGAKALQSKKVTFTVTVKKVQEVVQPKLDDAFAAKIGPFKTVADLKADIKKELSARKEADVEQKFADDLLRKLATESKVAIPESLITEQLERIEQDQRQSLVYRGQTWQEYLEAEGLTEETYRKQHRAEAELRVKAGLVLSEVAELEEIEITPEELEEQLQALRGRYSDAQMQTELAKPETRRVIASRILTDKTVAKLKEYATK